MRLLEVQAGVAHVAQLCAAGLDWETISFKVSSGSWHWLGSRLITTTESLYMEQREWAALAAAGRQAALCGLSAAAHHGLEKMDDGRIHVVVPRGARPPALPLPVRVHKSRRLDPVRDLEPTSAMPMTRPARSIVDAATWSAGPRRACAVLVAAVRQGICTVPRLIAEVCAHGPLRHRRIMLTVLRDVGGGPAALCTVDLARLARQHGLPRPRSLTVRAEDDGRRRFLEAEFTSRRGKSWLVQIDAAAQLIVGNYWSETRPPDDLIMTDESMLYFPSVDLYLNEIAVVSRLHQILND
jgi:hypothetical protein